MNPAEVRMTFEEWGEVLRIAATIWPQSRSFFDDSAEAGRTPTRTWWAALCRFETDDVLAAIGRLGMTSRYWPSLAEVVEATREVLTHRIERRRRSEQLERPRLAAPRQGSVVERLDVFDRTSVAIRRQHRDELRRFAPCGSAAGEVDVEAVEVGGPWEKRLRELIAQGWPGCGHP